MDKIEGVATFTSDADARTAVARLAELRHDNNNALVGGSHDTRIGDDGATVVTFSYRVAQGAALAVVRDLEKQLKTALAAGGPQIARGEVEMDDDEFFDEATGKLVAGRSNRVVHTYVDDETGETRTRTLIGKTRMAKIVDADGTELGEIAVRSQYDEDGNKVTLPGPAGEADPSVVVEKF